MNHLLPVIVFLLISGCGGTSPQQKANAIPVAAVSFPVINYDSCKKEVGLLKQRCREAWQHLSKQEKEKLFVSTVTGTIIPGWIGTPWSFNGTSEKPQEGSIACGYFVTTVLHDAGLKLQRIKLAQCASENMITTLVQPKYISRFSNVTLEQFIAAVGQQGYGLYIVGLDNHTGFIFNDGSDIHFIHSTFVGTRNVQNDNASVNRILRQSHYKVLGKISADERVLQRWIN
ncbi:MAG TPA: hypothetical protein PLZ45_10725 [Ferruginibacter sp.]|nr:hypothetical protein [Ferruginibacter sp.]